MEPHDKILELLIDKDEITWQTIIYDLVKSEEMNPWDINVSLLTQRYMETIKKLKELDFRVSGKVLLAAAILLKIKSNRLIGEDLNQLDRLFASEDAEEELYEEEAEQPHLDEKPELIPRVPQPRKRKISVYDLVNALEKALEVKKRRVMHSIPPTNINIPTKTRDITTVIKDVYGRIKLFFAKNSKGKLTFSQLIPSDSKEDKVYTFIPLLHLATPPKRKIDLEQYRHFGEIDVMLRADTEVGKELAQEKK